MERIKEGWLRCGGKDEMPSEAGDGRNSMQRMHIMESTLSCDLHGRHRLVAYFCWVRRKKGRFAFARLSDGLTACWACCKGQQDIGCSTDQIAGLDGTDPRNRASLALIV